MKRKMIVKRQEMRNRLSGYVRDRVLPVLGLAGADFDVEVPLEGTRSLVFFLNTEAGRHIVKCLANPVRAARTAGTSRHMGDRGAPVPRLLFQDLSPLTWMRLGCFVLVEEAIDGRNLYELEPTPERLAAAAGTLASMHAITRPRWGGLPKLLQRRGRYFDFMHARLLRRVDDLVRNRPECAVLAEAELRDWLFSFRDAVEPSSGYHLCHLRVTETNVLFTEDDQVFLIDLVTARYAHHAIDLERALQRWCGSDEVLMAGFLDAYFQVLEAKGAGRREEWERTRPYFRTSFHLTQAYRHGKESRALRAVGGPKDEKAERSDRGLRRHVRRLAQLLEETEGAPGGAVIERLRAATVEPEEAAVRE